MRGVGGRGGERGEDWVGGVVRAVGGRGRRGDGDGEGGSCGGQQGQRVLERKGRNR